MLKHYIKSAFRNMARNKLTSLINIFGLAIGLGTAILAMLYSYYEFTYEKCYPHAEQIGKVITYGNFGAFSQIPGSFPQTAVDIPATFPEVSEGVVTRKIEAIVYKNNEPLLERNVVVAEAGFMPMFSYHFLLGQSYSPHEQAVCLSETLAKKYFGTENPLGKTLKFNIDNKEFIFPVSGVYKDLPGNTHIKPDILVSWSIAKDLFNTSEGYLSTDYDVYCKLLPNTDMTHLNQQIAGGLKIPTNIDECSVALMPISAYHLQSVFENNKVNLYILFIGGIIALVIAIFNYISQATILYTTRMQEVGIRLSNGGKASDIFKQFMTDTAVLTFFGFALALISVKVTLPYFNALIDTQLSLHMDAQTLGLIATLFFLTVFLSGLYPALVMARVKPVLLLRSTIGKAFDKNRMRNSMSTVQFVFAILLLQLMLVTQKQGNYLTNDEVVGFNSDNILVTNGRAWGELDKVKTELLRSPAITQVSWGKNLPAMQASLTSDWKTPDNAQMASIFSCEADFLDLFQIQMAEGRFFSNERKTDITNSVVVNQILADNMNWDTPIGQTLMVRNHNYEVIGVVDDYMAVPPIFESTPLIALCEDNFANNLIIRYNPAKEKEAFAYINKVLREANPNYPINLTTYDDVMALGAKSFYSTATLVNIFVGIIILNAFLSLFGLSYFVAERNKKQIGINKVFGASVAAIYWKLSKNFIRRFVIAFVLITPLSYIASKQYITTFSRQLPLTPDIFLLSGLLVLLMLLLSTGFKILNAAFQNPINSLRYE